MKISVVTVCYNARENIGGTMASVISQTYKDLEYIVVDGGSTDGTIDVVKEYQKKFPIIFISQKDEGIYDAMNKGIRLASGQWINFMNAGDSFVDKDVLGKISRYLTEENDLVYGATQFRYHGFSVVRRPRPIADFRVKMPFNHQSLFARTSLLKDHPFDTRYHLAADYEQVLFAVKARKTFFEAPMVVAVFNNEGVSNKKTAAAIKEYERILEDYHELTLWRRLCYRALPIKILGKKIVPNWIQRIIYRYCVR